MVKIVRETSSETVLEDRPWLLGLLLIGAIVTAAALLFLAWETGNLVVALAASAVGAAAYVSLVKAVRLSRLTLRSSGQATLSIRDHTGWTHRDFPPGTLRAGLESHRSSDGATFRPVLLIDGEDGVERVPLTAYFGSHDRSKAAVARIEDWRRATA